MRKRKYYTYRIGWSDLDLYYYGYRGQGKYGSVEPEDDLWVRYFTSSPGVAMIREKYGDPDIVEVRKKFSERRRAQYWESEVIRRIAYRHPNYINGMNRHFVSQNY